VVLTDQVWWKTVSPDVKEPLKAVCRSNGLKLTVVRQGENRMPRRVSGVLLSPLITGSEIPDLDGMDSPVLSFHELPSGESGSRLVSNRVSAFAKAGEDVAELMTRSETLRETSVAIVASGAEQANADAFAQAYQNRMPSTPPLFAKVDGRVTRGSARQVVTDMVQRGAAIFLVLYGPDGSFFLDAVESEGAYAVVPDMGSTGAYPGSVIYSVEGDLVAAVAQVLAAGWPREILIPSHVVAGPALADLLP
jgi:hypothetical protein